MAGLCCLSLVDDVTTLGGTLAQLADGLYLTTGRDGAGAVTLTNASRTATMVPSDRLIRFLSRRFGNAISELFGIEPRALTESEARYLSGFQDVDALRTRAAQAQAERVQRLSAKGLSEPPADLGPSRVTESQALFDKSVHYALREGEPEQDYDLDREALGDLDCAGHALSSATGAVARPGGPGVNAVALGISPDLIHQGVVDLKGYRVEVGGPPSIAIDPKNGS